MKFSSILAAVLAILTFACSRSNEKPLSTSVCELARDPSLFSNKIVQIEGYVDSDGFEWLLLRDSECIKSGINLEFVKSFASSSKGKWLNHMIFETPPLGTDYKDLRGKFVGEFAWDPSAKDRHLVRRLIVQSVNGLTYSRRLQKRVSPYPELR